jgi:predicted ArsR family transcriptional regulator
LLADILASYLAASSKIPAGLAEEAGHAFAKRHWRSIRPATPVPANEIIHRVVAMFTEFGFEPELTRRGQDLQIRLHACPFRTIASRYPEVVCAMHLGLLRGTLVELGASTTTARLRSFVEPHLCVAHITSTSQSAPDADKLRAPSLEDQPDRAHP